MTTERNPLHQTPGFDPHFDADTDPHFVLQFDESGEMDYEAVNFTGKNCDKAARKLMETLAAEEIKGKRKNKPTYNGVGVGYQSTNKVQGSVKRQVQQH